MAALDQVRDWPAVTAAAGWTGPTGTRHETGPVTRSLPLASVTKPLVAYAVLIAVEEGTLGLDQPAGPPGATVAHLLSHASGLAGDDRSPVAPPGRRRIYANANFEILGDVLAAAAGISAAQYTTEAVVEPLGLTSTVVGPSSAHGASSTVADMLTLGGEWLAPTLIAPSTMALATSPWLAELGGVLPGFGRQSPNPWGLGFELRGHKWPHWTGRTNTPVTFGHFGRSGAFLWVDPEARVVCCALTDEPFGPWAATAWPALADAVLAESVAGG